DDLGIRHINLDNIINCNCRGFKGICLWYGARKSVKQEAITAIRLADPLLHQIDDDIIRYKCSRIHDFLGHYSQLGTFLDSLAKYIGSGDLRYGEMIPDKACLRALSGSRCA